MGLGACWAAEWAVLCNGWLNTKTDNVIGIEENRRQMTLVLFLRIPSPACFSHPLPFSLESSLI